MLGTLPRKLARAPPIIETDRDRHPILERPHPAIVNRTEIVDQIREAAGRAGFIAGDEAAFIHATVIDVDDTRMSVAVIAGP